MLSYKKKERKSLAKNPSPDSSKVSTTYSGVIKRKVLDFE